MCYRTWKYTCERIFIKTHSTESRCAIGPGNVLFIKTHSTESRCAIGPGNVLFIKTHSTESRCAIGPGNVLFIKTHSTESRCAIGPGNVLFADGSVHLSARKFYRLGVVKRLIIMCVYTETHIIPPKMLPPPPHPFPLFRISSS